jgi:hypothetical protein
MAREMVSRERYKLSRIEIEAIAIEYFSKRGLSAAVSPFIDYFINKGILIENYETIQFKFRCFCEFFIAKRMLEDKSFYMFIMDETRYLAFANESDYLTGLQRDNVSLLKVVYERTLKFLKDSPMDIDLSLYTHRDVQKALAAKDGGGAFIQSLKPKPFTESERDQVLDCMYAPYDCDQDVQRRCEDPPGVKCFYSLDLLSRVIRNSELVDDLEFKVSAMTGTIATWAKFLLLMSIMIEYIFTHVYDSTLRSEESDETRYVVELLIPIGFQYIILNSLGSDKSDVLIKGALEESNVSLLEKVLLAWLYADLRFNDYMRILKNVISGFQDIFILELCILRLTIYYLLNPLTEGERRQLEELMAEVTLQIKKGGRKERNEKSKLMEKIRNKLNKMMRKKEPDV